MGKEPLGVFPCSIKAISQKQYHASEAKEEVGVIVKGC